MAWTYTTLIAAMSAWAENDATEYTDQQALMVTLAEDRIYRDLDAEVYRKYDTSSAFTQSTNTLAKPADIFVTRFFQYNNGTKLVTLLPKDVSFIQEYWPIAATEGAPKYYADYDHDTYIVAPTPDAARTVNIGYTYRETGLSGSQATSWLGTNTQQLLFASCMMETHRFLKNWLEFDRYEKEYYQFLKDARDEHEVRGRLTEYREGDQARMRMRNG